MATKVGLLVFLHGGGEAGDLNEVKSSGPPKALVDGTEFPFMVVAPQNPHKKQWWNVEVLQQLVLELINTYNIDKQKIYLYGLSSGAHAAWSLAINYPDTYAALMVVCGMAPTPYAHWLNKDLAIWVFHGAKDQIIPVQESDDMVAKLNSLGYNVNYTRYKNVAHQAWVPAYKTEGLYNWFANQKLKNNE